MFRENIYIRKFSPESQQVLDLAVQESLTRGLFGVVTTEDLAIGLLRAPRLHDSWINQYLSKYGKKGDLLKKANTLLDLMDRAYKGGVPSPNIKEVKELSPRTKQIVEIANSIRDLEGKQLITIDNLFAGVVIEGEGMGVAIFAQISTKRGRERLSKVDQAGRSGYVDYKRYLMARIDAFNRYILDKTPDKPTSEVKKEDPQQLKSAETCLRSVQEVAKILNISQEKCNNPKIRQFIEVVRLAIAIDDYLLWDISSQEVIPACLLTSDTKSSTDLTLIQDRYMSARGFAKATLQVLIEQLGSFPKCDLDVLKFSVNPVLSRFGGVITDSNNP